MYGTAAELNCQLHLILYGNTEMMFMLHAYGVQMTNCQVHFFSAYYVAKRNIQQQKCPKNL